MTLGAPLLFAAALAVTTTAMALLWIACDRARNAAPVDAAWALLFTPVVAIFAWLGDGNPARRGALLVIGAAWSLRLGIHLARRIRSEWPAEDPRYAAIREGWKEAGHDVRRRMFGFFLLQALTIPVLALPFLLAAGNDAPFPSILEFIGLAVAAIGVAGESIADRQLARFRAASHGADGRGSGVCRFGLWRFSRHPNYFFEWVTWCGVGLIGLGAPHGAWALLSPLLMLWLLLKVTGIPPAEERSLASRGEAYRAYQRTTNAFFPWRPRAADSVAPVAAERDAAAIPRGTLR